MEREQQRKNKEKEEKRHRELAMAAGSSQPIETESYYDPQDEAETYGVMATAQTSSPGAAINAPTQESFWVTLIASAAAGFVIGSLLKTAISSQREQSIGQIDEQQILHNYRNFTDVTGIVVSKQAHTTIMNTLTSIIVDPHPSWQIRPRELQQVIDHFIDNLPNYLFQLAKDERVSQQITSFDILHWLTRNLTTLCIIEKPSS